MRENLNFILIFGAMMSTIVILHGCTYLQSEGEPVRIACTASCDSEGNCTSEFKGNSSYMRKRSEGKLDTPTQTKVGLDSD